MSFFRRRDQELSCGQVARILQSYLDGELDDVRAVLVAGHLDDCRRCGLEADVYRRIANSIRGLAPGPDHDALARLHEFAERLTGSSQP